MGNIAFKEITIKVPDNVVDMATDSEILHMLVNKAMNKMEYFRTRCLEFEQKYNMDYAAFKGRVDSQEEEKFEEWDDLLLWEGYFHSFKEWESKYNNLKNCST